MKLVENKIFATTALQRNHETSVMNIAFFVDLNLGLEICLFYKAQIAY